MTRIVNIYGLSMHPNDSRVVSNVILRALRNEDMTLYGDGNQTRMSCYGNDLLDGFVLLVGTSDDFASPVNFGNPLEIPVGVMRDGRLFRPVAPGPAERSKGKEKAPIRLAASWNRAVGRKV